ncbi:MAG: hypothetical protein QN178_15790 [Armatimonadota bacterium]|nr:hypothetical protein [Armatimonadota bacterium]
MSHNNQNPVQVMMERTSQLQEKATVTTAFGEPIRVDNRTFIPAAKVRVAFGVGVGHGGRPGQEASGESGGGGGRSRRTGLP